MAKINFDKFKAPNEAANSTIPEALEFQQVLADLGIPFDRIVAIQGSSPQSPADEIDLTMLQAMKPPEGATFYLNGRYDNRDGSFEIGLERTALLGLGGPDGPGTPLDGIHSWLFLFSERNPGQTISAAIAAADNIPAVQAAKAGILDGIRAKLG